MDDIATRRRRVVVAGHAGDATVARAHLNDPDPRVRTLALGALVRCDAMTTEDWAVAALDPHPSVRRRAAEVAPHRSDLSLLPLLADADSTVVEAAAWACGERTPTEPGVLDALITLALEAADALCREAAVAALGAIGDQRGLPAIIDACRDRANVRRRAVLALAPFDGPEVRAALEHARADRDWQVRQAAEDLIAIIEGGT
jgi:HEAT repeat protein